jgi:GT2 family glycosyltransferase
MISIVIVNWNSGALLENCVRSLLSNAAGCQIVIVDNASDDSSMSFADAMGTALSVLRNSRNAGFAAGNNLGWRASKGDVILFLNPDIECLPGSIHHLEQTLASDPAIRAAGGCLISPSGKSKKDFNVRSFPTVGSVASEMIFLDEIWPSNPWSHRVRPADSGQAVDVDQPAAACLMVSRAALESIGGFDEAFYPAWFEDVDLCRRIRNQGGRIQFQPNARFLHHGGYSLGRISRQEFLESFHINQIRYFRKHYGRRAARRVQRLISLGLFLRAGGSLIHPPAPETSRAAASRAFLNAARRIFSLCEEEK